MFRIVKERLAWWPVMFPGVTEEGEVIENKIELRFAILDEDEFPEFVDRLFKAPAHVVGDVETDVAPEPESARAARVLLDVVRDWRDVAGENGQPISFGPDSFRSLLKVPGVGGAIGRAYIACRNATPEVREGN
jgi:hypothetical protein